MKNQGKRPPIIQQQFTAIISPIHKRLMAIVVSVLIYQMECALTFLAFCFGFRLDDCRGHFEIRRISLPALHIVHLKLHSSPPREEEGVIFILACRNGVIFAFFERAGARGERRVRVTRVTRTPRSPEKRQKKRMFCRLPSSSLFSTQMMKFDSKMWVYYFVFGSF